VPTCAASNPTIRAEIKPPARLTRIGFLDRGVHQLASADLYAKEPQRVPALQARHEAIENELLTALERWELLGSR
jgi:ATP-binding cassette subfamily F protein uup